MVALALCGPAFPVEANREEVAKVRADAWLNAETLTPMVDPDGRWRVTGYFIR